MSPLTRRGPKEEQTNSKQRMHMSTEPAYVDTRHTPCSCHATRAIHLRRNVLRSFIIGNRGISRKDAKHIPKYRCAFSNLHLDLRREVDRAKRRSGPVGRFGTGGYVRVSTESL